MKGLLFDIKRFAVHDGPGVRTVLFLKSCPLRCRWCHNPEGIDAKPILAFHAMKCLHCGECITACPQRAHSLVDGRHALDRSKCVACGECVAACLGKALTLYGREISVGEARKIILEDREFYKDGGGCTVSGGEPLLQADFCAELFAFLKTDGINCAVDTSGAVSWDSFKKVLPFTDIFLYDVKHVDAILHREHVGVSNKHILENLETLSTHGVPIEIRIPIIPGFNLDEKSMDEIGAFLSRIQHVVGVRLLPFHFSRSKNMSVGHAYMMPDIQPPTAKRMNDMAERLRNFNLVVH